MKVEIFIEGQINGNYKLKSALDNGTARKGMFNSFHIEFESMKDAKKAMRAANRCLKNEDNLPFRYGMSRDAMSIQNDDSRAVIIPIITKL